MHFASVTQSDGTRTMSDDPAFLPADQIHPVRSSFPADRPLPLFAEDAQVLITFAHENTKDKAAQTTSRYEAV